MVSLIDRRQLFLASTGLALAGCAPACPKHNIVSVNSAPKPTPTKSSEIAAWMEGHPPPQDKIIRFADGSYAQSPQLRWSFNHIEELVPTKTVFRGTGPLTLLPAAKQDLSNLDVKAITEASSLETFLEDTHTDGFIVLKDGNVVFERYFAHCHANARHFTASCTKSIVGTLAEDMVQRGELDRNNPIPFYVPELKNTAWDDATLGMVMDMQVGMKFYENYLDPESDVYRYLMAAGMVAAPPGETDMISFYQYLPTVEKEGVHGQAFAYREPNINVLQWVLRRVSGQSIMDLCRDKIWQPMGAERDAYFMLDGWGAETSICTTLRDFARFGEFIRNKGNVKGNAYLHPNTVNTFFAGGDREKFARRNGQKELEGWSYVSQWWVKHNDKHNAIEARGAYGQFLYIDQAAGVVIARFASTPKAPSSLAEPIMSNLFHQIATVLT